MEGTIPVTRITKCTCDWFFTKQKMVPLLLCLLICAKGKIMFLTN